MVWQGKMQWALALVLGGGGCHPVELPRVPTGKAEGDDKSDKVVSNAGPIW